MFCPNCGTTVADSATSCPQCGAQINRSQPMQGYGPIPSEARTDGKATASMILGILSLVCIGPIAGIPAIIFGHMSRSNIRKSMGKLKGDGMAAAGLVMGYISVVLIPFMLIFAAIVIPNLIRARISANEASAASTVRTLITAEIRHQANNPDVGYAPNIATLGADAGSVSENCSGNNLCTKSGYQFMIAADEEQPHKTYVITAVPLTPQRTGNRNFCADSDGVVRSESGILGRTTAYTPEECAALPPL